MAARPENIHSFDRTPPQNIDAERSVLGAMLLNPDAVGAAIEVLHDDPTGVFYVEAHQHIYEAMLHLFRRNIPVDVVTLLESLNRNNRLESVGGPAYLAELTNAVPTSANVEHYARIVLEMALLRRLISACTRVAGKAYEGGREVEELLDGAEQEIFAIAEQRQVNPIFPIGDLIADGVRHIEQQITSHTGITGLATGFSKLDEMLSGLQRSDMVVLAARPSVGKTAFALNIASHAAVKHQKSVIVFSLEMAKEQLVQRLLCMEGRVDSARLRTGFLARNEFPKVQHAAGVLSRAPIYIDDTANVGPLELRSKARRHAIQHQLDLIIVDYLQLMSTSRRTENRQVEIAEISRALKGLARELRVPVLALSQLSREAEKDDTGTPKLSHLRESGAIEQDADVVLMLSRPPAHEREGRDNLIQLTVAKQRNGPTGTLQLLFEKNIQLFRNLAEEHSPAPPPPQPSGPEPVYDEDLDDDDTPF